MTSVRFLPLLLALNPAALPAQQEPDPRWLPWMGCWQVGRVAEPGVPLVCVRPASQPLGVEVATVAGGEIGEVRVLVADDQPHGLTFENCAGSQVATFSADGWRVYLRSTLTCEGGTRRTASAVMAMASPTEWLDAQSLGVDDRRVPRVLHYYPAPVAAWPGEFLLSPERSAAGADARTLAADRLALLDVREAASRVDGETLAAFLLELNQRFDLSASVLVALAEAQVPAAAIDALVAVSYPERFVVDRGDTRTALRSGEPRAPRDSTYDDPYRWGWVGYGPCLYVTNCDFGLYTPSDYAYRRGWPLGYDPSWFGGYWGPVTIVDRSAAPRRTLVTSGGYTRGGQSQGTGKGRYAKPRSGSTSGTGDGGFSPSVGGGTSSSSAGSASPGGYSRSGGGSSSSGGSSGGTAKPRGHN